jgi:hypothetical protein
MGFNNFLPPGYKIEAVEDDVPIMANNNNIQFVVQQVKLFSQNSQLEYECTYYRAINSWWCCGTQTT